MPASAPKILIATFGSLGDLHPFVALAHSLAGEGFDPVLAAPENYRDYIRSEGLSFAAVRPDAEQLTQRVGADLGGIARRMAEDGGFLFKELIFPYLRESYADLLAASDGACAVVAHALAFAGRAVAEKRALPLINVRLSPVMLYSPHDPPLGMGAAFAPPNSALGVGYNRAALWTLSQLVGLWAAPLRRFRRDIGLPPAHGLKLLLGEEMGLATIGLFSPLLALPKAQQRLFIAGHSFHDRFLNAALAPEIEAFLDAGNAPVVFTLGSFVAEGRAEQYRACVEAGRQLGRRVLLLGHEKDMAELRAYLAPDVHVAAYVPHSLVFPRACVVVHHGGIGTSGQALRAGAPQLVTPYLGDQYDNAERLRRLGVARRLDGPSVTTQTLARELAALLGAPDVSARAAALAQVVAQEDGAARAARFIAARLR